MRRFFCGIDPGLSGALALYDPNTKDVQIIDMPTETIKKGKKKRTRVDLYELARWIDVNASAIIGAIIENVHTMPGQGVVSSGNFMRAFGNVEAAIASAFVPIAYVTPQKWKAFFGLGADKDGSRTKATELSPMSTHWWTRKKDHGRAEALLLAVYGSTEANFLQRSLAA